MNTLSIHSGQGAAFHEHEQVSPLSQQAFAGTIFPLSHDKESHHAKLQSNPQTTIRDVQSEQGPSKVRAIAFSFMKDAGVASLAIVGFGLAAKIAADNPVLGGLLLGAGILGTFGAQAQKTDPSESHEDPENENVDQQIVCPYWAAKQEELPEAGVSLDDMKSIMKADKIDNALIAIFIKGAATLVEGDIESPIHLSRLKDLEPVFGPGTLLRSPDQEDKAFQNFADQHKDGCSLPEFVDFQRTRFLDQNASFKDRLFRVAEVALWIQRSQGTIENDAEKSQISGDMLQSLAQRKTPESISPVKLSTTLKLMARINTAHTKANINQLLEELGIKPTDIED